MLTEKDTAKQLSAYATLVASLEAQLASLLVSHQQSLEAIRTLQSERDANAVLTEEVSRLGGVSKAAPRDLAYELMSVLADVREIGWDDDCRVSVQYVMTELLGEKAPLDFAKAVSEYWCTKDKQC